MISGGPRSAVGALRSAVGVGRSTVRRSAFDGLQYSDGLRAALKIYLIVYFTLVAGAAATLWRSGLIEHLPRGWTLLTIVGALALGVLLAALSRE